MLLSDITTDCESVSPMKTNPSKNEERAAIELLRQTRVDVRHICGKRSIHRSRGTKLGSSSAAYSLQLCTHVWCRVVVTAAYGYAAGWGGGWLFAELYDDGCASQVLLYMIALQLLHASHPFCVEIEGEKADVQYPAVALRVPQLIIVYLHPLQLYGSRFMTALCLAAQLYAAAPTLLYAAGQDIIALTGHFAERIPIPESDAPTHACHPKRGFTIHIAELQGDGDAIPLNGAGSHRYMIGQQKLGALRERRVIIRGVG